MNEVIANLGLSEEATKNLIKLMSYPKSDWMLGSKAIAETEKELDKATRILRAIRKLERNHANCIAAAQDFSLFPELRAMYTRRATNAKLAAIKSRQNFNLLLMELSL